MAARSRRGCAAFISEPPALRWAPLNSTRARSGTASVARAASCARGAGGGSAARELVRRDANRPNISSRGAFDSRRRPALRSAAAARRPRGSAWRQGRSARPDRTLRSTRADVGELQQPRCLRNQQADRQLNRRDVPTRSKPIDLSSSIAVAVQRRPRREGDERRRQRQARRAAQRDARSTKSARVCPFSSCSSTRRRPTRPRWSRTRSRCRAGAAAGRDGRSRCSTLIVTS